MKKLYYILTSLILLLPNLSFGQVTYLCSKPEIATTQTSYTVGSNLNLEIFQVFSGETATSEEGYNLFLNFIYPNGDTTSLIESTGEDGIYSVRNNLTLADSGWYYVRFRQGDCPTTLDSIRINTALCNTPAITTTDNVLTLGETLKLEVLKFSSIGAPEPKILFTGPNNFRAGPWSWDSITGGNEDYEFTLLNNFKGFNVGKYYATFITAGCDTISDSINIVGSYNSSYIPLPFGENFDLFRYNTLYPKWTFTGDINDQGLSRGYWHGTVSDYQTSYNCLIHNIGSITSYKNDTIVSPIFVNTVSNDTTHLTLRFELASSLRRFVYGTEAKYDTLIVNAYFSNNNVPVTIRKISGFDLLTSAMPTKDSVYVPKFKTYSFFKPQEINLSNYDTCSTVRFHFIHKPTVNSASSSILLDNIEILGIPEDTIKKPPTISVDSVVNLDPHCNLILHFPQNHNIYTYKLLFRRKVSEKQLLFAKENLELEQINAIEQFQFIDQYFLFDRNKDTIITIPIRFIPNGIYEFGVTTVHSTSDDKGGVFIPYNSNIIPVIISWDRPPIKKPILSVDSIYNNDKNFRLTLNVPENHNSWGYQIYEDNNIIYAGLTSPVNDTNLVFHDTTIVFNRINMSNGIRKYKAELINSFRKPYNVISDIVNVTVDYSSIPLGTPQISVDSIDNKDKNFNISVILPSDNNGDEYGLIENNATIQSIKISDNKSALTKVLSLTNKPNGTYTYNSYLKKGNRIVKSLPISVTVNYTIPPALACTSEVVTASNRTKTNFTYSFKLNANCSNIGYKALFYAGNNANGFLASNNSLTESQVKSLTWTPTVGTPRNGVGPAKNIQLTQTEVRSGFFNRKVDVPLSFGNRWYRVDIVCTSCNQLNKTKTAYFYVTN
jgi:hypothetical protein